MRLPEGKWLVPLFIVVLVSMGIGYDFIRFWIKEGKPSFVFGALFAASLALIVVSLFVRPRS